MFAIQSNNVWLKLKEDSVLNSTFYSQLIYENKLRGAFTIPLQVPIEGNENFFENRFYLKSLNGGQSEYFQVVKVYVEKVWWLTGKLILLSNTGDTLNVNLVVGLPGISSLNKKLQELTWERVTLPSNTVEVTEMAAKVSMFQTRINGGYDDTDYTKSYTFPLVKNNKFYGSDNENNLDYLGFMNNYDPENEPFGFVQNVYLNKNAMCPMLYVIEILSKGFKDGGYKFNWSLLPGDFRRLVQFNNYELNGLRNIHGFRASLTSSIQSDSSFGTLYGPIVFDDTVTGANYFWGHLYNTANGKYTIKRAGRYKIEYNIPFNIIDTGFEPSWTLTVKLTNSAGTFIDSEVFVLSSPTTSGVAQKRIFIDFAVSDVNDELYLHYFFTSPPGGTTPKVVLEVDSWFKITCISNPTVNYWGSYIYLDRCVPQDVLFKDYVNAFAATYNVEFIVNDNEKTITAKLNEPDITAEPVHKEELWQSNSEKPLIELRAAKYNLFNYGWSGSDDLIRDNFKTYNPSEFLAEEEAFWQIGFDYPADETFNNKKIKVWNENKIYVCQYNETLFDWEWVPFTDDYIPAEVGAGTQTLSLPISPLLMTHYDFLGFQLHIPVVEMEGYSPDFKMDNKDVGLRVIFFFGRIVCALDGGGDTNMIYSYINSYTVTPTTGGAITFTFTLELSREYDGTEKGLLGFWKNSIATMNLTRRVTKKLYMSMCDILNWSFRKRVYMGGAVMMPEQLNVGTRFAEPEIEVEIEFGLEEVILE